ncbi:glycoside hydrolase family 88/105 protein [Shouchella clausii]|uniref:glycoside hydrolase family 88/105 protein n=1 Tax=Shouchella clausii TaxID=79880 RepID=UPI000BA722CC|nr:glycoside hydrolase family 88 protein [Shouchella clausii]PAD11955.1 glycoside hydrolase 105 family protein [Shouchella clausii]PAD43914.1 glycoside hydrolase 105 family protein [Bacillus sp. 7520-S]PAD90995.1 glycoside hydrolase 105 family protein [Shouchella clausii]
MTSFAKVRSQQPLEWGKKACEAIMSKYEPVEMPPANRWHYHQGVFLCGVHRIWEMDHNEAYFQYVKDYVDALIDEDGNFLFRRDELDAIQAGLLLLPLFRRTGEYRYQEAARKLRGLLHTLNRNRFGGFWHKDKYPNQMWLDGLYMAGPFAVQYGQQFNEPELIDLVLRQEELMRNHTKDEATGLYVHAWDASKQVAVCDKETGKTEEVWGRALGWYAMALADLIDLLGENHMKRPVLESAFQSLMARLPTYQDEQTGLWYQVVDKGNQPDNWLESSCTSLFVYALAKGYRLGLLGEDAFFHAEKGLSGLLDYAVDIEEDGALVLKMICIGTSIGRYDDYISRPTSANDLHGVGAFALACTEIEKGRKHR